MTPDLVAFFSVCLTLAGLILGTVVLGVRELRRDIASPNDLQP